MSKLILRLEQAGMAIAVVAISLTMLLISADAVLRYAFNAPLRWAFEVVTYYMMVVGIYFALSSTFTRGDHVNITLLRDIMPRRLQAWLDIIWVLVAAFIFGCVVYGTWEHTMTAYERHEFMPGYILWPAWLSHLPVPMGCALIVLRLLHHALVLITTGQDPLVEDHGDPVE